MAFVSNKKASAAPTVTEMQDRGDIIRRFDHPAFGQLTISRRQGGRNTLYGSDLTHNTEIAISVYEGSFTRRFSTDWYDHKRLPIVELTLSEAQWSTFVSAIGIGSGVPCTLQYRSDVGHIPSIEPTASADHWRSDFKDRATAAEKALADAIAAVDELGLSKVKAATIREKLKDAQGAISSGLPFIAERFTEHMTDVVEAAKANIHAHLSHAVATSGLEALQHRDEVAPAITHEAPDDER